MAGALDQTGERAVRLLRSRLRDPLAAVAGSVITLSDRWGDLDDDTSLDLLTRTARRVDEAAALTSTVSDPEARAAVHAVRNALHVLKLSLWILLNDWKTLSDEQRRGLLESASLVARSGLVLSPPDSKPGSGEGLSRSDGAGARTKSLIGIPR